jgi:hypothetical protein
MWKFSTFINLFRYSISRIVSLATGNSIFGNWIASLSMPNWKWENQCLLCVRPYSSPFFTCFAERIDCWNCALVGVQLGNFQWCCTALPPSAVSPLQDFSSTTTAFSLFSTISLRIIGACSRIARVAWRILHWGWAKKCPDKMSDML